MKLISAACFQSIEHRSTSKSHDLPFDSALSSQQWIDTVTALLQLLRFLLFWKKYKKRNFSKANLNVWTYSYIQNICYKHLAGPEQLCQFLGGGDKNKSSYLFSLIRLKTLFDCCYKQLQVRKEVGSVGQKEAKCLYRSSLCTNYAIIIIIKKRPDI